MKNQVHLFSPATVANVSCGFDVLGLAMDTVGDEMTISRANHKQVRIAKVTGQNLPMETHKNVAGVAILALLTAANVEEGFDIEICKNIKPGSGIGSSAASAAGAVFGVNHLLGNPFTALELIQFAMEGEKLAGGVAHADNVAPALLGGFTLVRSYEPLDVIKLHSPKELFVTILHPQIEVKTSDAREILKTKVTLKDAIKQWGNVGGLVSGLFMEDYDLISRSLQDHIIEPIRSILIPAFDLVKRKALETGALGCGISGSGPSMFALSRGYENAEKVAAAIHQIYQHIGIAYDIHISPVNQQGIKILSDN